MPPILEKITNIKNEILSRINSLIEAGNSRGENLVKQFNSAYYFELINYGEYVDLRDPTTEEEKEMMVNGMGGPGGGSGGGPLPMIIEEHVEGVIRIRTSEELDNLMPVVKQHLSDGHSPAEIVQEISGMVLNIDYSVEGHFVVISKIMEDALRASSEDQEYVSNGID